MTTLGLWIGFHILILLLLVLDLGVFHRHPHQVTLREAIFSNTFWLVLALAFNAWVAHQMGAQKGLEFFTGYTIERALSIDNLFVFAVLFRYFGVAPQFQHRVLFWGIFGALAMRGGMIAAGAALLQRFSWVLYIFGAFVLLTGIRLLTHDIERMDPSQNFFLRLARRYLPVAGGEHGQEFLVREQGRLRATPLLLVLLMVEVTDLAFAVDSVPAVFSITRDAFIVYTSNILAILGLRAFYFLLAAVLPYFHYLSRGLSWVLIFIGAKMLAEEWIHISTVASLLVVAGILGTCVVASLITRRKDKGERPAGAPAEKMGA